jgi:glycosyltransferase involved in cell wall biosynthesis
MNTIPQFKDLVLLICPVRNEREHVGQLISSLEEQTLTNWKIVFFDNNSSDETKLIIGKAAEQDKRIVLEEFHTTVPINSNFNRSVEIALTKYRAEFVGFIGGDDRLLESDYLENLVRSLKDGHSMAIPKHKIQYSTEENSYTTTYRRLSRFSRINLVMQCWDAGYGNIFYSLYRWKDFVRIFLDKRSKLTSNLSSDWWFINTALRVIEFPPKYVENATYIKFNKGYGYDSEYYHAGENHVKAMGLSRIDDSSFTLSRLLSRLVVWFDNLVAVPFLIVFRGRDRVSFRSYPEMFIMICIMITSKITRAAFSVATKTSARNRS